MFDLREKRKEKGVSGDYVSKMVGITQQHYSYVENRKRRPSVDVAKRIASVLGFDWTLFYEDGDLEDEPQSEKQGPSEIPTTDF